MKIGISALTLSPGRSGGIETYFRSLLENLERVDSENIYKVFLTPENRDSIYINPDNFSKLVLKGSFGNRFLRRVRLSSKTPERNIVELINRINCDVIHFPLHVIYPAGLSGKKVISVMDIQEKYWPEFFSKEDLESRERLHDSSIISADHIITISKFTKDTVVEKFKVRPSKISVVQLAYNEALYNKECVAAPKKKNAPKKFFFYPAATWPHKNHLRLLDAMAQVSKAFPDFHLVLSGIKMQQTDLINLRIKELGIENKVHLIGYVNEEELPWYYRNAFALVFPSLFEGFGIPVLEAFASSCPVLCSNTTSLPEVAGDAALYFDPLDANDIAKRMQDLVNDKRLRQRLIEKGAERLKNFSQRKMAEQTLDVYKKVLTDG